MHLHRISMEVLLLQDVNGIGKKNDLVVVGDGFALNCLLPKRVVLVATPLVRRRYADSIRKRAEERETERQAQAGLATALANKSLKFVRKATKTGKLYGAITEEIIAESLKQQFGLEVPALAIQIDDHIKAVGTFQVRVKLGETLAPLQVTVEAETAKVVA